jgi:hypothetical protein
MTHALHPPSQMITEIINNPHLLFETQTSTIPCPQGWTSSYRLLEKVLYHTQEDLHTFSKLFSLFLVWESMNSAFTSACNHKNQNRTEHMTIKGPTWVCKLMAHAEPKLQSSTDPEMIWGSLNVETIQHKQTFVKCPEPTRQVHSASNPVLTPTL